MGGTSTKAGTQCLSPGWVCTVIRSAFKINFAVLFLSKNPRPIFSKIFASIS